VHAPLRPRGSDHTHNQPLLIGVNEGFSPVCDVFEDEGSFQAARNGPKHPPRSLMLQLPNQEIGGASLGWDGPSKSDSVSVHCREPGQSDHGRRQWDSLEPRQPCCAPTCGM
jgi:hypothetical protein